MGKSTTVDVTIANPSINGILGGLTGLAGIVTTVWCGMRGWGKDEQRAVFQPVGVAIIAMSGLWLGVNGPISSDTIWFFVVGLPVLFVETWGLKLCTDIWTRLDFARSCLSCCCFQGLRWPKL